MFLVKIILVILCVIVALRILGYVALRYLAYKLKKTFKQGFPQNQPQKKEGEITIDIPGKYTKDANDKSEYIDYEEVK